MSRLQAIVTAPNGSVWARAERWERLPIAEREGGAPLPLSAAVRDGSGLRPAQASRSGEALGRGGFEIVVGECSGESVLERADEVMKRPRPFGDEDALRKRYRQLRHAEERLRPLRGTRFAGTHLLVLEELQRLGREILGDVSETKVRRP